MTADPLAYLHAAHTAAQKAAETAAKVCGCHPPVPSWIFGDETTKGRILIVDDPHPNLHRKIGRRWNGSYEGMFTAEHIVLHDPDAVLRRIAADRKLIELHAPASGDTPDGSGVTCNTCCNASREEIEGPPFPCDTIRAVAEGWGWKEDE